MFRYLRVDVLVAAKDGVLGAVDVRHLDEQPTPFSEQLVRGTQRRQQIEIVFENVPQGD